MKVEQRQMQNDQKRINSSNNSSSNFNSVADQVSKANMHHGKLLVDTSLPEKLISEGLPEDSSSTTSELFYHEADLSMTNTKHVLPEQVVKESTPKESSLILMKPQKIEKKQVNLSEIKVFFPSE
ncbi:6935_t:CDS:2 [Racocetra persica]|uniref:6935_t:CDS:1 n=1 Tax=Racocetra persica TaxID=160502 RepID=A0ACA9NKJ0_9GLOM|nr:6935_t:CDS:2 [Racocetra persica]